LGPLVVLKCRLLAEECEGTAGDRGDGSRIAWRGFTPMPAVRAILKKGRSGVAIPLEFRCFTDIIVAVSHGNHVMA
jgi:hypothetical protein